MLSSNVSTWLNRNCSSCFVKCQHNQTIHYFCFVCGLICQIFLKVIVNCRGILLFINAVSNLSLFANCNKLNLIHTLVAIVEVASSSFVRVVRGQLSWYAVVYEWRIILVPICKLHYQQYCWNGKLVVCPSCERWECNEEADDEGRRAGRGRCDGRTMLGHKR
jgi:hypothetical protein